MMISVGWMVSTNGQGHSNEMLLVVMIHFGNVDVDHVQTLGNIFNGIDNHSSWSLITPYLGLHDGIFCNQTKDLG